MGNLNWIWWCTQFELERNYSSLSHFNVPSNSMWGSSHLFWVMVGGRNGWLIWGLAGSFLNEPENNTTKLSSTPTWTSDFSLSDILQHSFSNIFFPRTPHVTSLIFLNSNLIANHKSSSITPNNNSCKFEFKFMWFCVYFASSVIKTLVHYFVNSYKT